MASYFRSILPFAAAVASASVLSIASPASAAGPESGADGFGECSARDALPTSGTGRRSAFGSPRHAIIDAIDTSAHRTGRDCSDAWCGRHFVLMIGIGY